LIFRPKRVKSQLELHLSAAKPAAVNCYRICQRQLTIAGGNLVISMSQYELFDVRKAIFMLDLCHFVLGLCKWTFDHLLGPEQSSNMFLGILYLIIEYVFHWAIKPSNLFLCLQFQYA